MRRFLAAAAALISACAGPTPSAPTLESEAPLPVMVMHAAAPDIHFTDLSGQRHLLSEFKGKTVVLFFYAARCQISERLLPKLDGFATEPGNSNVAVVPVERTGAVAKDVQTFVKTSGTRQTVYFDTSKTAATSFGIDKQPWVYIIAPNFQVEADLLGELPITAYRNIVRRVGSVVGS